MRVSHARWGWYGQSGSFSSTTRSHNMSGSTRRKRSSRPSTSSQSPRGPRSETGTQSVLASAAWAGGFRRGGNKGHLRYPRAAGAAYHRIHCRRRLARASTYYGASIVVGSVPCWLNSKAEFEDSLRGVDNPVTAASVPLRRYF